MADVTARTLRPSSAPVHGTLFLPTAAEPVAAVLVIGGSGGSESSYVGQALATEGIAALSVAYFGREGLPARLRGIRLEYFFLPCKPCGANCRRRRPAAGCPWLLDGQPLPSVDHAGPDCEKADALIPAELIPGPVLLIAAGADAI
jgi:hypothetical protein